MRNTFGNTFYQIAKEIPDVYIVVSDISPAASMDSFRKEFPHNFINVGVAEQSMIGLCAGIALRGCRAFAYTIATFTIYRPFEQVRVDLCYQNLPVTIVGIGAGVTYSTLGGTHHAQEDIAIMSALPNMSILAPCDPKETEAATWASARCDGPVYLRLGKAGEPDLTSNAPDPFVFGKIRFIKPGTDVCILSYGPITKMASDIATRIENEKGKSVAVVSVHTLKPLDKEGIQGVLDKYKSVVVIEEHSPHGGLGPQVKQIAWDMGAQCKLRCFSLKDEFIHSFGSQPELWKAHGLDPDLIISDLYSRNLVTA
jgi:transketolase